MDRIQFREFQRSGLLLGILKKPNGFAVLPRDDKVSLNIAWSALLIVVGLIRLRADPDFPLAGSTMILWGG